ncbi:DNA-binding protein [Acholeplasma vituli]|uniref:UPF0122 protein N7603_03780 n=1 Tax=Paracholeplasma vituli TaxID=69473 RepID=A0ABT2PUZ9_9MOLU|nr:sigma factor-like helix-turn-helix DNA-binding protein [Paracholeplasma vituli]MCU0104770.1 DNA-binding protein [Paracholeplasma vituli]
MDQLAKTERLNQLYELYGVLLTDKQQAYFVAYYQNDFSLAEIASEFGVSRNAVFDQLNTAIQHLENYEEKLKLLIRKNNRLDLLKQYEQTGDVQYLEKLAEMDDV